MRTEFALTVSEHRRFGLIVLPVLITIKESQSFYNISEQINTSAIKGGVFTKEQAEIINIAGKYSDQQLYRSYSKHRSINDFINSVEEDKVEKIIRPYIESKMYECLRIAFKTDIPVYFKKKKFSSIHKDDQLIFNRDSIQPIFVFDRNEEGVSYSLGLHKGNEQINLISTNSFILVNKPAIFIIDNIIYEISDLDGKIVQPFLNRSTINIPKKSEKVYFEKFVARIAASHKVISKGFDIIDKEPSLTSELEIKEGVFGNHFLELSFKYDDKRISPESDQVKYSKLNIIKGNYFIERFSRNISGEQQIIEDLKNKGLIPDNLNSFVLDEESSCYDLVNWVNSNNKTINRNNITVKQHSNTSYYLGNVNFDHSYELKDSYYEVDFTAELDNVGLSLQRLKRSIVKGDREVQLDSGEYLVIPQEYIDKYHDLFQFGEISEGRIKLQRHHFKVLESSDKKTVDKSLVFNKKESKSGNMPAGLKASLREYQKVGYSWMRYLNRSGFGGCLADDMGLGKTIQTLALLQKIKEDKISEHNVQDTDKSEELFSGGKIVEKPVSLLVVPVSLVHNWENEIRKFTPGLKALIYKGAKRRKTTSYFNYYDVIITSYGTMRLDIEMFKTYMFEYIILDESQYIKNPNSQIYKAVNRLESRHKLVLTGTPIENNLVDLWAQINFINPGLLGSLNFFKRHFVAGIHKNKSEAVQDKLKSIIEPFILRRKKEDVAKELPPVTEQIVWCEMDREQFKVYDNERKGIKNSLFNDLENRDVDSSSFIILQALTRLRQVANHPKLIDETYEMSSGKFDNIVTNLENVLAEGHKVLIFSSFVKYLEILEGYLKDKKHKYSILTGKSTNRAKIIDEFTQNETNNIFLISLKAGGVGLNLTEADYVFILDPWWNPAAEDQAVNRSHRIGQERNVFVQRFISVGTIEEKIQKLKEEKAILADTFINSNNPLAVINREELVKLFD
jgi:SNF2 family DNA or RNA helicase